MALYLGSSNVSLTSGAQSSNSELLFPHTDISDNIKIVVNSLVNKVKAVQTDESITFIAMSDAHQLDTNVQITNGNKHACMACKVVAYSLPKIDFACYLGDYTWGSNTTTIEEGKKHLTEITEYLTDAFGNLPQFRTLGNHDSLRSSESQNGRVLTAAELKGLALTYPMPGSYSFGSLITSDYCYKHFNNFDVICLNTAEDTQKEYVSDAQKQWFAEKLQSLGENSNPKPIFVLSHHPLDWGNVYQLSNIIKAYFDKSSIIIGGTNYSFVNSGKAPIICIHGHTHCYKYDKLNYIANGAGTPFNIWRVATPNMCYSRNNEYGANGATEYYGIEFGETITYTKTNDGVNDTAFTVNVFNPSEEKLYSFHYGAGIDREIFIGQQNIAVNGVSLNASSGELTVGGQTTLTAVVQPSDATNKAVIWSSSAPTVASVSDGVITALTSGNAVITVKTVDGNFTASYNLTVKAASSDLIATYGYADNMRLSTSSGSEKPANGYVVLGHNSAIPIDKVTYPNGAVIRVSGADDVVGNSNPYTDSAWVMYTTGGTTFNSSSYIKDSTQASHACGTFTVDSDRKGFTLDIASLSKPHYIKFCFKGTGVNITATLTPK